MKITLMPNTVITCIGPSHSGKSTIANSMKNYLGSIGKTCQIISSDNYRRELLHLNPNDPIPTSEGLAISEVAFKKLKADLEFYMSHPCNTDVIVVDTTGLDKTFRQDIVRIAKDQSYANISLVFQLSKATLFNRLYGETQNVNHMKFVIDRQLTRLKENVLPFFNKHDYISTYRIDDKKKNNIEFEYKDSTKVLKLDSGRYAIYGDIHQQVNPFETLYKKAEEKGFRNHILIGDYLDKDDEQSLLDTIYSVYEKYNQGNLKIIKANHEEYVYRHLIDPNYIFEENNETAYFTSLKYLMKSENEDYRNMFLELYMSSYDYALIKNDRNFGYITHSPCLEKYLGKHSPKSLKMMRNTRFFQDDENGESKKAIELLGPIIEEAASNKPLHIFGHVEIGKNFHVYKNKIGIDTGCVSGGHLTAMLYDLSSGKKEFISVQSDKPATPILDLSVHIKQWTNRVELLPHQERQLRRLVKSNPAFISGTVSPSPSITKGEVSLESVESTIELFKSRGINEVIAQKKHMGSRCQVYLFKNREDCYATSRNGYKIRHPDIERLIDIEFAKYQGKYETLLITDNELMPWRFLGKGLVDTAFMPYYQAVNSDLRGLKNSGLKDFVDIGENVYDNLEKFNKQVEIYAEDVPGHLETFGVIYIDGQELITADQSKVLPDFGIAYETFNLELEEDASRLKQFYEDMIADGKTEGIAVKPLQWKKDDIPCIKVRNPEYLRIVYGYDYTSSLQRYAESKNINNKLRLSIKEHNLNLNLLEAYRKEDKKTQKEIYASLLTEFEKETSLDPRL